MNTSGEGFERLGGRSRVALSVGHDTCRWMPPWVRVRVRVRVSVQMVRVRVSHGTEPGFRGDWIAVAV